MTGLLLGYFVKNEAGIQGLIDPGDEREAVAVISPKKIVFDLSIIKKVISWSPVLQGELSTSYPFLAATIK